MYPAGIEVALNQAEYGREATELHEYPAMHLVVLRAILLLSGIVKYRANKQSQ